MNNLEQLLAFSGIIKNFLLSENMFVAFILIIGTLQEWIVKVNIELLPKFSNINKVTYNPWR